MISIAPATALLPASQEPSIPNYAKDLISFITDIKSRETAMVNDPINEFVTDTPLPSFFHDKFLKPYTCSSNVSCDLHYDLDWSYRLRTIMACADAVNKDPCYATNACLCSNGYFSVSDAMPETSPDEYSGDSSIMDLF